MNQTLQIQSPWSYPFSGGYTIIPDEILSLEAWKQHISASISSISKVHSRKPERMDVAKRERDALTDFIISAYCYLKMTWK